MKVCNLNIVGDICYFRLYNCSDDEFQLLEKYKQWIFKSWKFGNQTKPFVFPENRHGNPKVVWTYLGFASNMIRHLQEIGYIVNGKEAFTGKNIIIGNLYYSLWDFQREAVDAWLDNGGFGIIKSPTGCITGDSLISTNKGLITIKELHDNRYDSIKVMNYDDKHGKTGLLYNEIDSYFRYENKDILYIRTTDGSELKCTPEHRLTRVFNNEIVRYIEAKNLEIGDVILKLEHCSINYDSIEYIEKRDRSDVYDLAIKNVPNYIANGFVVHNSGKSIVGCEIIKRTGLRTLISVHTSDLMINVWFNNLVEQFSEGIKGRLGIIGGGLTKKDRKSMRLSGDCSFEFNINRDIVIATAQSVLNNLDKLNKQRFGLFICDECIPIDSIIETSAGSYTIGELYERYNGDRRYEIERMKVDSLNLDSMDIIQSSFIPKKTAIKRMYKIKIETGIELEVSYDHRCLSIIDDNLDYGELDKIRNIGINVNGNIIFSDIVDKKYTGEKQGFDLQIKNKYHNYFVNNVNIHNCHHYSAEQFKAVANNVSAPFRCGLSATLSRADGTSPMFFGLLGDICYNVGIRNLVEKGILVEPKFETLVIDDAETQMQIVKCGYKQLELSRYIKKMSASSVIKKDYIIELVKSLYMNRKKFIMYTDFVTPSDRVFTRDDYVKEIIANGINVYGVSSELSSNQRERLFNDLKIGKLDGLIFGALGSEGVNIPAVDSVIMCNATASPIRFPQRVGRAMRSVRSDPSKKYAYIYEICLNVGKELDWSNTNFYEYRSEGYFKDVKYIKSYEDINNSI
jgi:superfamily II DNA or RNA helicase